MPHRPSYGFALVTFSLAFLGYLVSLAPTVTFWDAGEFIAAAKTLGIPHPPGTPLFVLVGHVWGELVAVGEYAWRLNLMSGFFGALAAAAFFLVVQESLRAWATDLAPRPQQLVTVGGGIAAALIGAFTFTVWQNSNETEVYAIAVFSSAAICWLAMVWRAARGTPRAPKSLLLMLYLAGLSIGNHLLALLAGPAIVAFLATTLRRHPALSPMQRSQEFAQLLVVAGTWALLIGTGLGSTPLMVLGAICFLAAAGYATRVGALPFSLVALGISLVGVSTYLFLFLRSGQHPMLNEASPDTWDSLLAVIRREQYPVRTPLDDPTELHGPGNPGRSLTLIALQLVNYIQYFDWQWANGLRGGLPLPGGATLAWRTLFTVIFFGLGLRGLMLQRRSDRPGWWLLFILFLTTGLGLVAYMNFKPGFSLGWDRYPDTGDHEVRERDYFFVLSFAVWGLWAGMGLARLARTVLLKVRHGGAVMGPAVLALGVLPFLLNYDVASRRHGPEARLAADFAHDLLNSVPPYGILFTYGDNDTFPLWWAQEVEGIRPDVAVVCLALGQTDWYMRQVREWPVRRFDPARAPAVWRGPVPEPPSWPMHTLTDEQIAGVQPVMLSRATSLTVGSIQLTYDEGTILEPNDFLILRIVQQNIGRRPLVWALTTGGEFQGLDRYIVQQGLGFRLYPTLPDSTAPRFDDHRIFGTLLDVPVTDSLIWDTYRYAGLLDAAPEAVNRLEPTSRGIANNLSIPFVQLAYAYQSRGDPDRAARNLERAARLSSNPALKDALNQLMLEERKE